MPQRDIKFKGWNYDTGKMVDLKLLTPLALSGDISGLFLPFSPGVQLLQWTGVVDIKGRDIYEHDIVAVLEGNEPVYWTVAYVENAGTFELHCEGSTEYMDSFEGEMQVVGNIYENIGLLNSGK